MIEQKIKANSLVYTPRYDCGNTKLTHVQKHNKPYIPDRPFILGLPHSSYYINEDGKSGSGERIAFANTPENKKFLEDLFGVEFESYEDSDFYKNIQTTFSDLIDMTEGLSEVSFNKELSEDLRTLYSKYYKD